MHAHACGTLLARAHARSGDIAKIAGYCGRSKGLDEAMGDFAEAYGAQTERDHDALVKAIAAGKIPAEMGIEYIVAGVAQTATKVGLRLPCMAKPPKAKTVASSQRTQDQSDPLRAL